MEQTINIRNVRGGAQVDRGGLIGYLVDGDKFYLQPGDNVFPLSEGRKILGDFHHQGVDVNGKPRGKPMKNGDAWQSAGWVDVRYSAVDEIEPEAPKGQKTK